MIVYPVSWISCLWWGREGHGGSRQKWLGVDRALTGRALECHLLFSYRDFGACVVKLYSVKFLSWTRRACRCVWAFKSSSWVEPLWRNNLGFQGCIQGPAASCSSPLPGPLLPASRVCCDASAFVTTAIAPHRANKGQALWVSIIQNPLVLCLQPQTALQVTPEAKQKSSVCR